MKRKRVGGGKKGSRANVYKRIIKEKNLSLEPKLNADNTFETFLNVVISLFKVSLRPSMTKSTLKTF